MVKFKVLLYCFLTAPTHVAFANSQIEFNIETSQTCLIGKEGFERLECAGKASNACMEIPEGSITNVMNYCISREIEWWDAKLNAVYGQLLKMEEADDVLLKSYNTNAPKQAKALRDMQRSWIEYRDRLCEYEASQWSGGTGSGPAYLACKMNETARQYLILQNRIESGK